MRGAGRGQWAIVFAAALCFVGACGGRTDILSSAPIPESEFPDAVAHAFCDAVGPCCDQLSVGFDQTSCLTLGAEFWRKTLASATNRRYDPVAGGDCVALVRRVAVSCGTQLADSHACTSDLLLGTLAPGSSCTSGEDCAPPATCALRGDAAGSICIATPRAKEGDPCVGDCEGELGNVVGECQGGAASGADASSPLSIPMCFRDEALLCGSGGTCVSLPRLGESCASGLPCATGDCEMPTARCVGGSPGSAPPINLAPNCAVPFGATSGPS